MKIGIIGAMEEEIAQLKREMVLKYKETLHHITFFVGTLHHLDIVLVQSGIGKVNAALTTTLLIECFEVSAIINTGTAGAIDPALEIGDIVIADRLIYHDVDVTGFDYQLGQMAGMPEYYYSDAELLRIAQSAVRSQGTEPIIGLIVSGDEFVNDNKKIEWIQQNFKRARACEMESTAIAQTAYVLGVPFIIVRAISDSADQSAAVTFDEFIVTAGSTSAQMVSRFIHQLAN